MTPEQIPVALTALQGDLDKIPVDLDGLIISPKERERLHAARLTTMGRIGTIRNAEARLEKLDPKIQRL